MANSLCIIFDKSWRIGKEPNNWRRVNFVGIKRGEVNGRSGKLQTSLASYLGKFL